MLSQSMIDLFECNTLFFTLVTSICESNFSALEYQVGDLCGTMGHRCGKRATWQEISTPDGNFWCK